MDGFYGTIPSINGWELRGSPILDRKNPPEGHTPNLHRDHDRRGFHKWRIPNSWLVYWYGKSHWNGWELGVPLWLSNLSKPPLGSSQDQSSNLSLGSCSDQPELKLLHLLQVPAANVWPWSHFTTSTFQTHHCSQPVIMMRCWTKTIWSKTEGLQVHQKWLSLPATETQFQAGDMKKNWYF